MQTRTISATQRKQISAQYTVLLRSCRFITQKKDLELIRKAFEWALNHFRAKIRETGEPYFFHSVAVARILAEEMNLQTSAVVGALLQDVVVEKKIDDSEIEKEFGTECSELLKKLRRIALLRTEKISLNAENFIHLLLTLSDDIRVILIRLADRLHFMRHFSNLPHDRQKLIAAETSNLYAPLAHRLGLYRIKTELEDLSMRFAYPEIYQSLEKKIADTTQQNRDFIENFVHPIKDELKNNRLSCEIKSRTKSIPSIWNKMKSQQCEFEDIYDFFAVRIIIHTTLENEKADCWKVYGLITNLYQPNPTRMRDWISVPKQHSGYESLHATVLGPNNKWVEVQIRSKRMDEDAEKGTAAHWKYKSASKNTGDFEDWLKQLRVIVENYTPEEDEKGNSQTKIAPLPAYIFVFTPDGDLKKLPENASVLDFAYEIHTYVGEHCNGAKVNNLYVPLKYQLKTGDQVEIVTSKNQRPNADWLNWATTSRALNKIRRYLKEAEFQYVDIGRDMLLRKLAQLKLTYSEEIGNKLITYFKVSTASELFQGFAIEKFDLQKVKEILTAPPVPAEMPKTLVKPKTKEITEPIAKKALVIVNDETPMRDVKMARCCQPVVGDEIFGFVTVNEGIKIHRKDCQNARSMQSKYPYRVVKTVWVEMPDVQEFATTLQILAEDRLGLLNSITDLLTQKFNANIRSINLNTNNGAVKGTIMLSVSGQKSLETIMAHLAKLAGVEQVRRVS